MYAEILILGLLRRGAMHGYEIKQAMERVLAGARVTNSQLYPTLKRFEEMGAVTREVIPQTGKPDRHQYRLTLVGVELLHDLLVNTSPEIVAQDREFYVRAAHFDLVSSEERLALLNARKGALTRRQDRVTRWVGGPWPQRVGRLRSQLLADELAVIDAWIAKEMTPREEKDDE